MLIHSPRHTHADRRLWAEYEEADLVHADTLASKIATAESIIRDATRGRAYCGVSWGKDSVVLADMVARVAPRVPLVWIRIEPIANPDCLAVRDAFVLPRLLDRQIDYHEIVRVCECYGGDWHASGTLESGAAEAVYRFGSLRLTGIRSDESGARALSAAVHGVATDTSVRPLLHWTAQDVFAYLAAHSLPVHPAYGCLGGGRYERERLRVASLGGQRGRGRDRDAWEREYYGAELRRLESAARFD